GAARAPADVKVNLYERGLSLEIPARWTWNAGVGFVNRATSRYFLAANGPLTDLPVVPGNGDVDASALPTGRVVVAVEEFCRLGCSGPTTETALPLDWSTAAPFFGRTVPSDRHEGAIGFRLFDQPLFVVARWADDAIARLTCAIPGRVYEWTRFGTYLGPEPASNLTQHRVIVRDGQVWVRYIEEGMLWPSVPDEPAEY